MLPDNHNEPDTVGSVVDNPVIITGPDATLKEPVTSYEPLIITGRVEDPEIEWEPVKNAKLASSSSMVNADPFVCLYVKAMSVFYYNYIFFKKD